MGRYNATRSPGVMPRASRPFATRPASRRSSPYEVRRNRGDPSDAETIAVFDGSARKQLWAMLRRAPGSHSGWIGSESGFRISEAWVWKGISRRSIIADQNTSRCSVDHRWKSRYVRKPRPICIAWTFESRIVLGDGTQTGPGPSSLRRPSYARRQRYAY